MLFLSHKIGKKRVLFTCFQAVIIVNKTILLRTSPQLKWHQIMKTVNHYKMLCKNNKIYK